MTIAVTKDGWRIDGLPVQRRCCRSGRYRRSRRDRVIPCWYGHRWRTGVLVATSDVTRRIRRTIQAGRPASGIATAAECRRWSRIRTSSIRWTVGRVRSTQSPARRWSRWRQDRHFERPEILKRRNKDWQMAKYTKKPKEKVDMKETHTRKKNDYYYWKINRIQLRRTNESMTSTTDGSISLWLSISLSLSLLADGSIHGQMRATVPAI